MGSTRNIDFNVPFCTSCVRAHVDANIHASISTLSLHISCVQSGVKPIPCTTSSCHRLCLVSAALTSPRWEVRDLLRRSHSIRWRNSLQLVSGALQAAPYGYDSVIRGYPPAGDETATLIWRRQARPLKMQGLYSFVQASQARTPNLTQHLPLAT